jgi:hypothetical protein
MRIRRFSPFVLAATLTVVSLLVVSGSSRVRLAYASADLLLASYAESYLELDGDQRERWEPELQRVLALHRREELPRLAAFFDRALRISEGGFDAAETACLVESLRDIYQRHARLTVELATPLLANLRPAQVQALEDRFARDLADDQTKRTGRDQELRDRAARYRKAIEEWTGPLGPSQRALVEEVTRRMPDTREPVLAYRTQKRAELIALLRSRVEESRIRDFLTDWLVDFRDLPPELSRAGPQLEGRLVELLNRLGETLTPEQRARLAKRLSGLRSDLLKLQGEPRLAPLGC